MRFCFFRLAAPPAEAFAAAADGLPEAPTVDDAADNPDDIDELLFFLVAGVELADPAEVTEVLSKAPETADVLV